MRFAISPEGIMQDMFMGAKNADGTWHDWERTVLVEAPTGYMVGEYWTEDMEEAWGNVLHESYVYYQKIEDAG